MKSIKCILFTLFFIFMIMDLSAQNRDTADYKHQVISSGIEVYYFHKAHRCVSCRALQIETDKALKELYPEELKTGELVYLTYSIDDEANDELMEKYKATGQKLLIVKGTKQKVITDTAYSIITSKHPERLKQLLQDSIEDL